MTILLDPHTLIWFLDNDSQLPLKTRTLIETTPPSSSALSPFGKLPSKQISEN